MSEEKMFEAEVGVGNFKLMLTRAVEDDGNELIMAKVWPTWAFGDWRATENPYQDPKPEEVELAVGAALGRHLEKPCNVRRASILVAKDGEIAIKFVRAESPAGELHAAVGPAVIKPGPVPPLAAVIMGGEGADELTDLRNWRHKQEALAGEADEARAEWEAAEEDAELAKKKAKAAEATYQEIMTRLRRSILAEEEEHPLFKANGHQEPKAKSGPAPESPKDEEWRKTPLADLGLSKAILGKLEDGWCKPDDKPVVLTTVGQLADWIAKMGTRNFTDPLAQLKGVGSKAAETITAALDKFWEDQAKVEVPAPEETKPAAEETKPAEPETPAEPPKRKRGRPKKLKGGTNDEQGPLVPPDGKAEADEKEAKRELAGADVGNPVEG